MIVIEGRDSVSMLEMVISLVMVLILAVMMLISMVIMLISMVMMLILAVMMLISRDADLTSLSQGERGERLLQFEPLSLLPMIPLSLTLLC